MSPEAQNIAIAKHCGWTFELITNREPHVYRVRNQHGALVGDMGLSNLESALPDYGGDLNAMHEAELTMGRFQAYAYRQTLSTIGKDMGPSFYLCHATAAQKAEAFLRSLGLWVEETEVGK